MKNQKSEFNFDEIRNQYNNGLLEQIICDITKETIG